YLVPRRQESGVGDRGAEEVAGVLALASGPVGHTVKLRRRAGTTKTRRYEDAAGLVDEKSRRKYKRPDSARLCFPPAFFVRQTAGSASRRRAHLCGLCDLCG